MIKNILLIPVYFFIGSASIVLAAFIGIFETFQ